MTLQDASHFTSCIGAADVRAKAICLPKTTAGEIVQVCEPGGSFESI